MVDDNILIVAALGLGAFVLTQVMGGTSDPNGGGNGGGGIIGGIGDQLINAMISGPLGVVDRFNPFTSGPIIPGVELW